MKRVLVWVWFALVVSGGACAPMAEPAGQTVQTAIGGGGMTVIMYRVPCPTTTALPSGQTCRNLLGGSAVWQIQASAMPAENREVRLGNIAYLGRRPGGAIIANAMTRFGDWVTRPSTDSVTGCRDSMWIMLPWDPYPWFFNALGGEIMVFDGVGANAPQIVSPRVDDYYISSVNLVVTGTGTFTTQRCSLFYGSETRFRNGTNPSPYTLEAWEQTIESYSATN